MTSPYLVRAAMRAKYLEARYIHYDEREAYEADGWEVKDTLGHHGRHALLATRRIVNDDTFS
jgi:hypothetical protein